MSLPEVMRIWFSGYFPLLSTMIKHHCISIWGVSLGTSFSHLKQIASIGFWDWGLGLEDDPYPQVVVPSPVIAFTPQIGEDTKI